jgi:hypothetical protein
VFLAHFGASLAAKRLAPRTSLGTLVFAGQFLDLLWPILLAVGLERVSIEPGLTAVSPFVFEHYPISHSLLGAAGWAVLVGIAYYLVRRYRTGAVVVGALVVSHWFLDIPVHIPDLPLWPGSDVLVGAGAWHSKPLTLALEFAALAAGVWLYVHTTHPRNRTGTWALWGGLALLSLLYLSFYVTQPTEVGQVIAGGFALWLFVAWGWWADRNRTVTQGTDAAA